MSIASPTTAAPPTPATVGLWLEFDAASPAMLAGDGRVRHARGLVAGLDALPGVEAILVPCLPADVEAMTALFADAARPGRLLSDKLRVIPAGRDPALRRAVIAWAERRRDGCRDRLAGLGATGSPWSWRAALAKLAEDPTRRAFATPRRIIKLMKLTLRLKVAEAILAATRLLPPSQASVVAELRRRGMWAPWLVLPAETASARRLRGPKILDLGGGLPVRGLALARLARAAVALVAPSKHAADLAADALAGRPCHVVPPAPLPMAVAPASDEDSRRLLGDDLRGLFTGDETRPLHRHFCDFPFERVEYLVASLPSGAAGPLLPAFAAVLRRHRRNLKLLLDGRLPRGDGIFDEVEALGLPFDVAECAGLSEAARARLLRHARAVVVADGDAACLPAVFGEAVAAGTPVVMGRLAAVREVLAPEELSAAEYFDPGCGEAELVRAVLHALDHRHAVVARQRAILVRLATRTWADVASDVLRLGRRA
jgi:glycosyltransferase involved in cell wall biosynthesis